jgi:hypothetical protein
MTSKPPSILLIAHDDYHAAHIGATADGRQFFLTTPFVSEDDGPGCEFVALYTFDAAGNLIEALVDSLGPRRSVDEERLDALCEHRLAGLGPKRFCDIRVKPFSVQRFGTEFGLIPRPPEEPDDSWWIILEPGDYMAFTDPWDGTYDT